MIMVLEGNVWMEESVASRELYATRELEIEALLLEDVLTVRVVGMSSGTAYVWLDSGMVVLVGNASGEESMTSRELYVIRDLEMEVLLLDKVLIVQLGEVGSGTASVWLDSEIGEACCHRDPGSIHCIGREDVLRR